MFLKNALIFLNKIKAYHLMIISLVILPIYSLYINYSVLVINITVENRDDYVKGTIFPNKCEFVLERRTDALFEVREAICEGKFYNENDKTTIYYFPGSAFSNTNYASGITIYHTPGRQGSDWYR